MTYGRIPKGRKHNRIERSDLAVERAICFEERGPFAPLKKIFMLWPLLLDYELYQIAPRTVVS